MYWNVLEKILYWKIYWKSVILVLEKHVYWKNYFKKGKCTGMYWKIEKVALNFFPVNFGPPTLVGAGPIRSPSLLFIIYYYLLFSTLVEPIGGKVCLCVRVSVCNRFPGEPL